MPEVRSQRIADSDPIGQEMYERRARASGGPLLERLDEHARCRTGAADEDTIAGPDRSDSIGRRHLSQLPSLGIGQPAPPRAAADSGNRGRIRELGRV
jgi:hypothetical protein